MDARHTPSSKHSFTPRTHSFSTIFLVLFMYLLLLLLLCISSVSALPPSFSPCTKYVYLLQYGTYAAAVLLKDYKKEYTLFYDYM